jgi:hypothetical protein
LVTKRISTKNPALIPSKISIKAKQCWALFRAGVPEEEISGRLKIDTDTVKEFIQDFEAARASVSRDVVDMATNVESLIAIDGAGQRLQDAQEAVRFSGIYDGDGNPIYERDWTTMMEAVKTAKGLLDTTQPKSGGPAINIGINNAGNNGNGGSGGQGRSFEAMIRLAEQRKHLELGDGRQSTVTADIIDADTSDDDDELDDPDDAGLDEDDEE